MSGHRLGDHPAKSYIASRGIYSRMSDPRQTEYYAINDTRNRISVQSARETDGPNDRACVRAARPPQAFATPSPRVCRATRVTPARCAATFNAHPPSRASIISVFSSGFLAAVSSTAVARSGTSFIDVRSHPRSLRVLLRDSPSLVRSEARRMRFVFHLIALMRFDRAAALREFRFVAFVIAQMQFRRWTVPRTTRRPVECQAPPGCPPLSAELHCPRRRRSLRSGHSLSFTRANRMPMPGMIHDPRRRTMLCASLA